MSDIGPGPVLCIKGAECGCGENVREGTMYQCEGLHDLPFIMAILYRCPCGDDHLWVRLQGKTHIWCPTLFGPLGDPDAVIKETDEPKEVKDVRWSEADRVIHRIKETENV
jgi:hypothetical protein